MTAAKTNEYRLQYSFEYNGKMIEAVTLRRAKGRDMERIVNAERRSGEGAAMIETVSCITDLAADAIREMDADDMTALVEMAEDFLPKARAASSPTGGA